MVTDNQVRKLVKLIKTEGTLEIAAAKAGMDSKTARKYRNLAKLPSEIKEVRTWRTREDSFVDVWDEIRSFLEVSPGLEGKTLFEEMQRKYPGKFQDGQLRTLHSGV